LTFMSFEFVFELLKPLFFADLFIDSRLSINYNLYGFFLLKDFIISEHQTVSHFVTVVF